MAVIKHGKTPEQVVAEEFQQIAEKFGGKIERDGNLVAFDGFAVAWKWRSSDPYTVLFFAVWPEQLKGQERATAVLAYMDGMSVSEFDVDA